MEGMLLVKLTQEAEKYIISIKIAGRSKVFGSMKFHAFAQMKGILGTIGGNVPFFGKTRSNLSRASFELGELVENLAGGGIKGRSCRIEGRVKAFGASFRAEHQCFFCGSGIHRSQQ